MTPCNVLAHTHVLWAGLWVSTGGVICYYCGEADCEDNEARCCERRRREVLGIDDPTDSDDGAGSCRDDSDVVNEHEGDIADSAQEAGTEAWTELQTGEFITQLVAGYRAHHSLVEGFRALRDGILEAKKHCPPSNRPWLDKLMDEAKNAIAEHLRTNNVESAAGE